MAYTLNYVDPVTGITCIYGRIKNVRINKAQKWASVQFDLYAATGREPVKELPVIFQDTTTNPAQFSAVFAAPPVAPANLPSPAVNVDDIATAQAYVGLKTHPMTQAMLVGATAN